MSLQRIEKKRQQLLELTGGLSGGQKLGQSGNGASTSGSPSSSKSSSLKSGKHEDGIGITNKLLQLRERIHKCKIRQMIF